MTKLTTQKAHRGKKLESFVIVAVVVLLLLLFLLLLANFLDM